MSVQTEINRIKLNINNALDSVASYGVQIEATDTSNELPTRIALIAEALEGFIKYTQLTLTETLKALARTNIGAASKSDIPIIPTNVSAFNNDAGYLTLHLDISGKLDVISDLDAIRSGAALGASALLSLPSNVVTTDTNLTIDSSKVFSKSISGNLSITWNLLITNGNFKSTSNWNSVNGTILASDNTLTFTMGSTAQNTRIELILSNNFIVGHKYLLFLDAKVSTPIWMKIMINGGDTIFSDSFSSVDSFRKIFILFVSTATLNDFLIFCYNNLSIVHFKNIQLFDLTQMFGSGNESTVEEFKSMFPLDYYEYNAGSTIEKALLVGSNINAPVLYEGGLKLSDKYNVNLGYKTLEELKDALKAIW